jgi:uncharacterized protein involved in oxidation of intracellular sulfur
MKKILVLLVILGSTLFVNAQTTPASGGTKPSPTIKPGTIGIVLSTNDPETVWNAFRLANYSLGKGDTVSVFLLGKGVEAPDLKNKEFDVQGMMKEYTDNGGKILACGTCLSSRNKEGTAMCPVSSLSDLYALIKSSSIVLTF